MIASHAEDILKRGLSMVNACDEDKAICRLLGGVAVYYLVHDIYQEVPALARVPKDIDLAGRRKESQRLIKALEGLGLVADKRFNALHGWERLKFVDPQFNLKVDVFLDTFRESHVIELDDRLGVFTPTIPPSDLLMTKLQIWEINEKDIKDIIAMLYKLELSDKDSSSTIDINRIIQLTSNDWGLYKTTTINLDRTINYMNTIELPMNVKDRVTNNISMLRQRIEEAPKSIKWRMRAAIGERVKWYETPEEA
ncbi:MAG: hypothetical protein TU36_000875 [Vulcanisaeta sp. AZ3]|jgi:hypothetical protein|nr:MAG: hypothetical protein TU36_05655 [Vulcanisaeta sp. AZ3]